MLQQAITNSACALTVRNRSSDLRTNLGATVHCGLIDDPDAALVSSLRAGDVIAFDLLVKRHGRQLLNVAMRITKNREDAEDVVQDSFLNVFKHLDSFRGASRLLSWLTRITINQALMKIRARPARTTSLDELIERKEGMGSCETKSNGYTPEQLCSQREFERLLFDWTTGMKEGLRRVLELRAVEDLADEEIAQVLGLTLSATKSRLCRARHELRKKMEKHLRSASAPRTTPIGKRPSPEAAITNKRKYDRDPLLIWLAGTLQSNDAFAHAQNVG